MNPLLVVKVIAGLVGFALVVWLGLTINGWRQDSARLPQIVEEAEKAAQAATARYSALQKDYESKIAASQRYEDEIAKLEEVAAAAPPAPVIRVCRPTIMPGPAAKGPAPAESGEAAAASGVLPATLELDTSPLYSDADRCDDLSAQVRQLIPLAQ